MYTVYTCVYPPSDIIYTVSRHRVRARRFCVNSAVRVTPDDFDLRACFYEYLVTRGALLHATHVYLPHIYLYYVCTYKVDT